MPALVLGSNGLKEFFSIAGIQWGWGEGGRYGTPPGPKKWGGGRREPLLSRAGLRWGLLRFVVNWLIGKNSIAGIGESRGNLLPGPGVGRRRRRNYSVPGILTRL
jgi:hypothetical protein